MDKFSRILNQFQPSEDVCKEDYCAYVFYSKQEFEGHTVLPLYVDEEEVANNDGKQENGKEEETTENVRKYWGSNYCST